MKIKYLFLILAIVGLICTWYFNIMFYINEPDTSIQNFISLSATTWPAKSISADISVVAICFIIWMIYDSIRLGIKNWWILILLTFFVALAFTFPLYLFLREHTFEKRKLNKDSN